jgi:hypothetical protein
LQVPTVLTKMKLSPEGIYLFRLLQEHTFANGNSPNLDSPIFDDKFIPRPDPGGNLRPIVPLSTHGSSLYGSRPSTPRSSQSRFSTHTTVEDRDTAKGIALVENAKSPTVHSSVPASSKKNDSGSWFIRFIRFLTMCVRSKEHEDASEVVSSP